MKKRLLSMLLAMCLIIGLLPLTAFAAQPNGKFYYLDYGGNSRVGGAYVTMTEGMNPVYLINKVLTADEITAANDSQTSATATYTRRATETPTDNYIKLEYPTGGVPTVTLHNVYINNLLGIGLGWYSIGNSSSSSSVNNASYKVILEGNNTIDNTGTTYPAFKANTSGDVTITGSGSLTLSGNYNKATGGVLCTLSNLILDNANVTVICPEDYGKANAIGVLAGNLTVKGGSLTVNGVDDPNTTNAVGATTGGARNGEAMLSAISVIKADLAITSDTTAVGGDLTIQDNAKVTLFGSPYQKKMIQAETFTIKDSDVEIAVTKKDHSAFFSSVAPTLTYTGGYTAIAATTASSYSNNTLTAPTTDPYDAANLSTYKYFKVTHGCVAGTPVPQPSYDCATEQGTITYCTICGEEVSRDTVSKESTTDHTPGDTVEVDRQSATSSAEGWVTTGTKCSVCGEVYNENTTILPAKTAAYLYYLPFGGNSQVGSSYRVTLNAGSNPVYFITSQADSNNPNNWYTVKEGDESNYNVKFDYTGDVATLTLRNAKIKNILGLTLGSNYKPTTGNTTTHNTHYKIVLIGENSIETTATTYTGLSVITNGDVTFSGSGSLKLTSNYAYNSGTQNNKGGAITSYGDIIFDNANIGINLLEKAGVSDAIHSVNGDVTIIGGNIVVNGWDDPSVIHTPGSSSKDYQYNNEAMYSAIKCNALTVKGGANVTLFGSPSSANLVNSTSFDIVDSKVELAIVAQDNGGFVSTVAPTISDSCDAVAGTEVGAYADGVLTAPATDEYNADDIATYKYLKVAPGLPKLYGASVILENSLDMEFAVEVSKVANGSYAEIVRTYADGKPNHVVKIMLADATVNNGFYVFSYEDIAAKEMGDKITVTIYDADDVAITKAWEDSVYGYALRMLRGDIPYGHNQAQFEELKKTLVDMIYYGYAAQTYFQYNGVVDPENDLSDEEKALASDLANLDLTFEGEQPVKTGGYVGTSFVLESDISMLMAIDRNVIGDASTAKVTFTNYLGQPQTEVVLNADDSEDGFAIFTFNGLVVADGRCDVTWSFYKNGETTATVTVVDSVVKYTARVNLDLAKYLMAYSDAADVYFNMMAQAV